MPLVTLKQLLEAGVHFGHQTSRWNPKMKRYIFTARNGIHIIDLQQTVKLLDDASNWVKDVVGGGRMVLFIGTKKQAQESIELEARRSGMPFGFHRRIARACVLLCLEMLLGAGDGGLRCIEIGGRVFRRTGNPGSSDGLSRIAHFLHRGAVAARQAEDPDKHRNEAQHKGNGH